MEYGVRALETLPMVHARPADASMTRSTVRDCASMDEGEKFAFRWTCPPPSW